MNTIKKVALISFIIAGTSQMVFASWWNPFTWNFFNKKSTPVVHQIKQDSVSVDGKSETKIINPIIATTSQQTQNSSPSIIVSSLKSYGVLDTGKIYKITWTSRNTSSKVIIKLFSEKNTFVDFLTDYDYPNSGSYSWTVDPKLPSGVYFIKVMDSASAEPGEDEISGKSDNFSIHSGTPSPQPPLITKISPNIAYVNKAKFGKGSSITVYGKGFINDYGGSYTIHLLDATTGVNITDVSVDTPSGIPTKDDMFTFSVPNSIIPGSYNIVIENSSYGLESNPYHFNVSTSSSSGM